MVLQGEAGSSKEEGDNEVGSEEVGEGDMVISMVAMNGKGELLHNQCPPALAANPSTFFFCLARRRTNGKLHCSL